MASQDQLDILDILVTSETLSAMIGLMRVIAGAPEAEPQIDVVSEPSLGILVTLEGKFGRMRMEICPRTGRLH